MNNRELIEKLTDIDESSKSTLCHSIKHGLVLCDRNDLKTMFVRGAILLAAKAHQIWHFDGSQAKSFDDWFQNEMGIRKTLAYDSMDVVQKAYELISTRAELEDIAPSKVVRVIRHFGGKTNEEKLELLFMAKGTTVKGLEYNLLNAAGKKAGDECSHEGDRETWLKCCICGGIINVTKM